MQTTQHRNVAPGLCARHQSSLPGFRRLSRHSTYPRCSTRRVSATDAQTTNQALETSSIVDEVVRLVGNTDGGLSIPEETKARIDELLDQLEERGRSQQPRPNLNPLLWGNYEVAYTSTRRGTERGQPAGGRFRNRLGRSLFRTEGLYQSCLQPDVCTNKVAFRLFGLLRGAVGLRGKITPVGDTGDTVRVRFEPTSLSFGPLHLRLGLPSEVQLTTTYLDERVRLGKGSRGSLFVFTRGGKADTADMELVGTQTTTAGVAALATVTYAAGMLGSLALILAQTHPLVKGLAACFLMLGGLIAAVLRNGGIVPNDRAARNVQTFAETDKQAAQVSTEAGGQAGANWAST